MKCECGQSMCYLCRAPIRGNHFYAQGTSSVKGQCPLFSDNKNLHKHEIAKVVEDAKKEIDLKKLKHDPTKGVEKAPNNFDPRRLAVTIEDSSSSEDSSDEDDAPNNFDPRRLAGTSEDDAP